MEFSLEKDGVQISRTALSSEHVEELRTLLSQLHVAAGHRHLTKLVPEITSLALAPEILRLFEKQMQGKPNLVRSIFFDKTPESNWLVPWHQDLTIAVKDRKQIAGYGPWSNKEGVPHVQPPNSILENMITVRLHLDAADEENGALQVFPKSHLLGRLSATEIDAWKKRNTPVLCAVQSGDALLMKPLLLHASTASLRPRHRRVIHLEYASLPLDGNLLWAEDSANS